MEHATSRLHNPSATSRLHAPSATSRLHTPSAISRLHTPSATSRVHTPSATRRVHTPSATRRVHTPSTFQNSKDKYKPDEFMDFMDISSALYRKVVLNYIPLLIVEDSCHPSQMSLVTLDLSFIQMMM
ncbi:hypothetical protein CHS0354_001228 [Potamilus streckersoni]|uniref:Uncharacterized protein n=1 Tax=Potamilus streckersoni TaxID=2493646 RepID=A0AAE0VJF5_9BIVA|nr:hypothetical protein CHS0354_001228 [Potamilus streckersoni]